jgi:SAM-dependent methyltransferase
MNSPLGVGKITGRQVQDDFNDPTAVIKYARAAHSLGLWESERRLFEHWFPEPKAALLEAGCGAGRGVIGLWELGYRTLSAFDFAEEPLDLARSLAAERGATIEFRLADATDLSGTYGSGAFAGACFLFNGLMQIPGRQRRRAALQELRRVCRPGAPILFTTHDRDETPAEQIHWQLERKLWASGRQDPRLWEFGDRYFRDDSGGTFMHLPDRAEILEDLADMGWHHAFDALRRQIASESAAVREFSDECRFWVARA